MGWWETLVCWHPTYPALPDTTGPKNYSCTFFVFFCGHLIPVHSMVTCIQYTVDSYQLIVLWHLSAILLPYLLLIIILETPKVPQDIWCSGSFPTYI